MALTYPITHPTVPAFLSTLKVTVVIVKSQRSEKYSSADYVNIAGILTYIDAKHGIAHNKIMVIYQLVVISGSFNFMKAAEEKNADILLLTRVDAGLVKSTLRTSRRTWAFGEVRGAICSDCIFPPPPVLPKRGGILRLSSIRRNGFPGDNTMSIG